MAHSYIKLDFGTDEEKAQQARHKLDGWKQAFRLDKRLLYKLDRPESNAGEACACLQIHGKEGNEFQGKNDNQIERESCGKAGAGPQRESGLAGQALFFFARKAFRAALARAHSVRRAV
jgi:hypothetical protein